MSLSKWLTINCTVNELDCSSTISHRICICATEILHVENHTSLKLAVCENSITVRTEISINTRSECYIGESCSSSGTIRQPTLEIRLANIQNYILSSVNIDRVCTILDGYILNSVSTLNTIEVDTTVALTCYCLTISTVNGNILNSCTTSSWEDNTVLIVLTICLNLNSCTVTIISLASSYNDRLLSRSNYNASSIVRIPVETCNIINSDSLTIVSTVNESNLCRSDQLAQIERYTSELAVCEYSVVVRTNICIRTSDECNILKLVLSCRAERVPALQSRVLDGKLTIIVCIDTISTVANGYILNSYITSTNGVKTADTILVMREVVTINSEVLNSRTTSNLYKTISVSGFDSFRPILIYASSSQKVISTIEYSVLLNNNASCSLNILSQSQSLTSSNSSSCKRVEILEVDVTVAVINATVNPLVNLLNIELDREESILSYIILVQSCSKLVCLTWLESYTSDNSRLSSRSCKNIAHVELYIEGNLVLLCSTSRDSQALIVALALGKTLNLSALIHVTELESSSTCLVSPCVLTLLVELDSTLCRNLQTDTLNNDIRVLVLDTVSESELNLRQDVIESESHLVSSLCALSWSSNILLRSVEKVLCTVNIGKSQSLDCIGVCILVESNLYILALRWSESEETINLTWYPVLLVYIVPSTCTARYNLTVEYDTGTVSHVTPYIKSCEIVSCCAWILCCTNSILNISTVKANLTRSLCAEHLFLCAGYQTSDSQYAYE